MFLDGLYDSFGEEIILDDDDVWNYDELNNKADCNSGIISYWYSDASDNKSYRIKPEQEHCTVLSM